MRITEGGMYGPYPWKNVLHWTFSGGPPSPVALATQALGIATNWTATMAPECPVHITLTKVVITDLTSNTAGQGEWIGNVPGTRGDDTLTANAAMLVNYPVDMRYRGGKPRTYLAVGGNADNSDAAHWSAAFVAEAESHWRNHTMYIASSGQTGYSMGTQCAISYVGKYRPNVPGTNYPTPLILSFDSNQAGVTVAQIASQKRRIGRR
jgi:hypothetical protein